MSHIELEYRHIAFRKNAGGNTIVYIVCILFLFLLSSHVSAVSPRAYRLKAWINDCMPTTVKKFQADSAINPEQSALIVCQHYAQVCEQSKGKKAVCSIGSIKKSYEKDPSGPFPAIDIKQKQSGYTLLIWVVKTGDLDTTEILLKNGADVNIDMGGNWTPLSEAQDKGNEEMIMLLKRYGAK